MGRGFCKGFGKTFGKGWGNFPFLITTFNYSSGVKEMTVTKEQIIKKIIVQTGLLAPKSALVVDLILNEMRDQLQMGKNVLLSGFGKFIVNQKKQRKGRNPKTNDYMDLRSRKVVTFRTSTKLKKLLNPELEE